MDNINNDLEGLWRLEEIRIRQRSRDRRIKEGDRNTAYFQAVANQRNMKKRIPGLDGPEGWIEENDVMLKHAVSFYKTLVGMEEDKGVSLGEDFWEESEKVSEEENDMLEAPFSEAEVKEAVFGPYAKGARDLMVSLFFSIRFCRIFLRVI